MIRIGVVGYSGKKFNQIVAKALMEIVLDLVEEYHKDKEYMLVSGLTDLGIPAIAYRSAKKRKWKTMGIACEKAEEYDLYPVDEKIIEGKDWGDESVTFLDNIDVLVRIGGGEQSMDEVEKAKKKNITVYEYDLPEIKEKKASSLTQTTTIPEIYISDK